MMDSFLLNKTDSSGLTNFNPVYLILKMAGKKKSLQVINESIKQVTEDFILEYERSGVCIIAGNPEDVENLLALTELKDGTPASIVMHPHRNVIRRVVNVAGCCNMADEEIQQELAPQDVIGVRRIKKTTDNGQKKDTEMLVLTYPLTAEKYKTVEFGSSQFKTFPYYTDLQQCFKCWEFRHIKPKCPQDTPICATCSGPHETIKDKVCHKKPFCLKCQTNDHPISSRLCPQYKRERRIHQIRIEKSIPYFEAKFEYEAAQDRDKETIIKYLSSKVCSMEEQMKKKDREIQILRALYASTKKSLEKAVEPPKPQQLKPVDKPKKPVATKPDKEEPPIDELVKFVEGDQEGDGKTGDDKTGEGKSRRKKRGKKGRGKRAVANDE